MDQSTLTKYQKKRLEETNAKYLNSDIYLAGTEATTRVSGTISVVKFYRPRKYLKFSFGLLFEDQIKPIFGPRKSFVLIPF